MILRIGTAGGTGVIHSSTAGYFGATATLAATYNWHSLCQSCHHTTRQLLESLLSPTRPSPPLSRLPARFPSWYRAPGRCRSGVRVGTYGRKFNGVIMTIDLGFLGKRLDATWYRTSSPCHLHNTEELLMDFYTAESPWRCREDPRGRITLPPGGTATVDHSKRLFSLSISLGDIFYVKGVSKIWICPCIRTDLIQQAKRCDPVQQNRSSFRAR